MEDSNQKYKELEERINKLSEPSKSKKIETPRNNANMSFNIAIELISAIFVGSIIGVFFDKMFDSKPVLFIICSILAMLAAFKTIYNKYIK